MKVDIGACTDVGHVRSANEDSYLTKPPMVVLADGMGGHVAGDVASTTAVHTIEAHSDEASAGDPETLAHLVRAANRAIWEKAHGDPSLRGMGTTCTLVYLDDARAHFAHVGDSRAYRLQGGRLEQLTEDHTLVARLVREGQLTAEEAHHHPQRSIITRALGVDADVSVDLFDIDLRPGDRLLLCSDGLSDMLETESIEQVLAEEEGAQAAAEALVARANEAGGEDNITVLVIDVSDDGEGTGDGVPTGELEAGGDEEVADEAGGDEEVADEAGGDEEAESVAGAPPPPEPPARDEEAEPAGGAPAPPPPELATRDETPSELPPAVRVRRARSGLRRFGVIAVIAVLIAGSLWAVDYLLDHSWFVGVNDDGFVTIYRGVPEELAGLSFRQEHEVTDITLTDLPGWKREDVANEMKFNSLHDAESSVANLERISREFEQPKTSAGAG